MKTDVSATGCRDVCWGLCRFLRELVPAQRHLPMLQTVSMLFPIRKVVCLFEFLPRLSEAINGL